MEAVPTCKLILGVMVSAPERSLEKGKNEEGIQKPSVRNEHGKKFRSGLASVVHFSRLMFWISEPYSNGICFSHYVAADLHRMELATGSGIYRFGIVENSICGKVALWKNIQYQTFPQCHTVGVPLVCHLVYQPVDTWYTIW